MTEPLCYSPALQVKTAEAGIVEGYASDFDTEPDLVGDVVRAGAFSKSLARHKARNTRPAMLWGHDQAKPIGIWSEVREDGHGLYVKGKLTLTVNQGREAYELAKAGALAFSIGFLPVSKSATSSGATLLEEIDLREISLVGLAANPRARISSVKSLSEVQTIREFEQLMRDSFGLSAREAKRLSVGGWKSYRPEDSSVQLAEMADRLRASANRFRGTKK